SPHSPRFATARFDQQSDELSAGLLLHQMPQEWPRPRRGEGEQSRSFRLLVDSSFSPRWFPLTMLLNSDSFAAAAVQCKSLRLEAEAQQRRERKSTLVFRGWIPI